LLTLPFRAGNVSSERLASAGVPSGGGHSGFRYAPGLDGVRALAVMAVFVYHLGTTGDAAQPLRGGFLGVDVFFVLSGYLITSLLVVEARDTGRISIRQFYLRRARRLFPAMFAVLIVVGVLVTVWLTGQAHRTRSDLVAAVSYVTNWWLIAEDSSYFGNGDRPRLLTHLWSLSVEEQFYLLWPLALVWFFRNRMRRGVMLAVLAVLIAASAAAGILLYDPWADPSRIYYGTDTRALAPLLGAGLALTARPWRYGASPARARGADAAGFIALLALAAAAVLAKDSAPPLYRGGFLAIAVLSAVLVWAAGHPATALGRLLGLAPLRWLGERSYAIYLWHWPVCVLTRPGLDVPFTGWANVALRVGIVLVLADLSYRLLERPMRRPNFFLGYASRHLHTEPLVRLPVLRSAALAVVSTVSVTTVGFQLAAVVTPAVAVPVDAGPPAALELEAGPTPSASPEPTVSASPSASPSTATKIPTVAIFGDSQGMTLMVNKPADLGRYATVTDATIEGCGILVGKVVSRSGERRDLASNCSGWRTRWASSATRLKPQIALVIIGAWELFDLTVAEGTLTFGTPEWDAHVSGQLREGMAVLRAAGSTVALALSPCYRPIKASAGHWPERGDDDRTQHLNALLRAAAAADPGQVSTVDPPGEFCTDPAISTNLKYRWDGVHYFKPGAALYFKAVIPRLRELAP
jgi:peptidoglycan/LPS O-acetylase OafA/YrhL